jgi:hypothetical protein
VNITVTSAEQARSIELVLRAYLASLDPMTVTALAVETLLYDLLHDLPDVWTEGRTLTLDGEDSALVAAAVLHVVRSLPIPEGAPHD